MASVEHRVSSVDRAADGDSWIREIVQYCCIASGAVAVEVVHVGAGT